MLCTLEQGWLAGLFGTGSQPQCVAGRQRQNVLLAAKIGLEERRNVDWEQDSPEGQARGIANHVFNRLAKNVHDLICTNP